jgi:hypothetical protein
VAGISALKVQYKFRLKLLMTRIKMPLVPDRSASSSFSFDLEAFRTTEQLVQTACTACEMASVSVLVLGEQRPDGLSEDASMRGREGEPCYPGRGAFFPPFRLDP